MTRGWLGILMAIGLALTAPRADAHHFFGNTYLVDQTVTLEGELAQLVYRNPHSLVHLVVRDKQGREVRYAVEWAGAGQLEEQGVTSDTLKVGDHIVVTGSPGRFPKDRRLRMATLHRPKDNFNYDDRREP
jgi:hypothetical protein